MALSIKERDFIHTAKFSGESTVQIVVTEILPYALHLVALQLYERYRFPLSVPSRALLFWVFPPATLSPSAT